MRIEIKVNESIENGYKYHLYTFYINDELIVRLTQYQEFVKLGRQRKFRIEKHFNVYEMRTSNIKLEDIPLDIPSLEAELLFQIKDKVRFAWLTTQRSNVNTKSI